MKIDQIHPKLSAETLITRLLLGTMLLLALSPASGGIRPTPSVLPPNSAAYGKTYGQWSEAWFQWCFSLPVTAHPIFDTAPVGTGQGGPVWFIGGNFTGTPVTRNVSIPAGVALFFPILNFWVDNTDCANGQMISDGNSEAALRAFAASTMNQAANLTCTIDGMVVAGLNNPLTTPYRAQSSTPGGFSYTLPPSDNLLEDLGLACWANDTGALIPVDAAIYHPVADGFYILVAPLPVGKHTIHATGVLGSFVEDFTYNIVVLPSNN